MSFPEFEVKFASWTEMMKAMEWLVVKKVAFRYLGEKDELNSAFVYRLSFRSAVPFFNAFVKMLETERIAAVRVLE